ncbi:MAG: UDP-2,3-diacylglucosamine diphosphatase [Candidatus Cyclonatronum sp.]|uniref:UDP-2,3-diacylglucosamine diphosphatase n=1 Tax=Cyclonatronum sp. TaxID=3024185 RepID=UPI0025C1EC8C|nr:UDP-2,3-diacylglucosamine diphosphatase [Cyclonatronum sp.]MCH8487360.1 UDP-2,3-diacylglucosamine diphosphatase [Cyclonatronum sp.]
MADKRELDLLVLSDVHLGTYGCHAEELNTYLKSVNPAIMVLNGDILDMWQFRKYYFPKSHLKVLKRIISMMSKGTKVYYLTGNHDENLRRFSNFETGNFHLADKLLLRLNGKTAWFFHGDVFDVTMRYSKWLAKLGGFGYDLLILINRFVNFISTSLGYSKISLSKKIKDGVKSAVRFVDDFERTATDLAIENGYDYVICGHIHRPAIKEVTNERGRVTYLNSGDWIENLSALEYTKGEWSMYRFDETDFAEAGEAEADAEEAVLEQSGIPAISFADMVLEELAGGQLVRHAAEIRPFTSNGRY